MRLCRHCRGLGKTNEDRSNCYRPGNLCKWVNDLCDEAHGEDFQCICDSRIVICKECGGRGVILALLEQIAECAECDE